MATAFEILDLARVCYLKKLEQVEQEEQSDKGKETADDDDSPTIRHIKERLADTHDALAEISLENERYVKFPWTCFGRPACPACPANATLAIGTPMLSKMAVLPSSTSWTFIQKSRRSLPRPISSFLWPLNSLP